MIKGAIINTSQNTCWGDDDDSGGGGGKRKESISPLGGVNTSYMTWQYRLIGNIFVYVYWILYIDIYLRTKFD